MIGFLILLGIVLLILFVPGVPCAVQLGVLITVLVMVILMVAYSYIGTGGKDSSGGSNACNTCNGPKKHNKCHECGYNPCKCTDILPGQTQCNKCGGGIYDSGLDGIKGCDRCGRKYRCPGCLL